MKKQWDNMINYLKKEKFVLIVSALAFVILLIVMIGFPILTNHLMFKGNYRVAGDHSTWIGYLGTFWGAIIGGVISGLLTLIGVRLTIKSTVSSKKDELVIQATKDRLNKLYHPIDALFNSFSFKHGAHDFTDLSFEEQIGFLSLLVENMLYADSKLYILTIEMQGAFKGKDYEELNERYNNVLDLVTDTIDELRSQLKLPIIY